MCCKQGRTSLRQQDYSNIWIFKTNEAIDYNVWDCKEISNNETRGDV